MQSEVSLAEANYAAVHAEYVRLVDAAKQRPGLIAEQELDDARAKDQNALAKINVAKASTDSATPQLCMLSYRFFGLRYPRQCDRTSPSSPLTIDTINYTNGDAANGSALQHAKRKRDSMRFPCVRLPLAKSHGGCL